MRQNTLVLVFALFYGSACAPVDVGDLRPSADAVTVPDAGGRLEADTPPALPDAASVPDASEVVAADAAVLVDHVQPAADRPVPPPDVVIVVQDNPPSADHVVQVPDVPMPPSDVPVVVDVPAPRDTPAACGGLNQPCCWGQAQICGTNLTCRGTGPGVCACGNEGEACCNALDCNRVPGRVLNCRPVGSRRVCTL